MTEEKFDFAIWKGDGTMICDLKNAAMEEAINDGMTIIKILRNKTVDEAFAIYNEIFNLGNYEPMDQ